MSKMQQLLNQLQEELEEEEEKSRSLNKLSETKKGVPSQINGNEGLTQRNDRIEFLEKAVEQAKNSERTMLESLVLQTKELAETKISLEEAKVEIRSLQEIIRILDDATVLASPSRGNLDKHLEKNGLSEVARTEEIRKLRNDLKLALQSEEKSKMIMDDLAIALKEVATEANQLNEMLLTAKSELERVTAEAERSKTLLQSMEEKCRLVANESEMLKSELEESTAAWNVKENVYMNFMKVSEGEITKLHQENSKLSDSRRLAREDNSKLRDKLKQAVNEATVAKKELEIARTEISQLKGLLSEKENALQSTRHEYECLKVSEAAALDSVKELKSLLTATSTMDPSKTLTSFENGSILEPKESTDDGKGTEGNFRPPSGRWKGESPQIQNGRSMGESARFTGSICDMAGSLVKKNRKTASLSNNVSETKGLSFVVRDDTFKSDDFDHRDGIQSASMEQPYLKQKKKKKRKILGIFRDMLRRKCFQM